jgi:hypothetical protein
MLETCGRTIGRVRRPGPQLTAAALGPTMVDLEDQQPKQEPP